MSDASSPRFEARMIAVAQAAIAVGLVLVAFVRWYRGVECGSVCLVAFESTHLLFCVLFYGLNFGMFAGVIGRRFCDRTEGRLVAKLLILHAGNAWIGQEFWRVCSD